MPKKLSVTRVFDELLEEVSEKQHQVMLHDSEFKGDVKDLPKKNVKKTTKVEIKSNPLPVVDEETKKQMLEQSEVDNENKLDEKIGNKFPTTFTRSDIFAPVGGRFAPATNAELKTAVNLWFSDNDKAVATYGDIKYWKTDAITDMSRLFKSKNDFNEKLYWNTSQVQNMSEMFYDASKFNQSIDKKDFTYKTAEHVILPAKLDIDTGAVLVPAKRLEIDTFLQGEVGDGDNDEKEDLFSDIKNVRLSVANTEGVFYPVENTSWSTLHSDEIIFKDVFTAVFPLLTNVFPQSILDLARENDILDEDLLITQLKVALNITYDFELDALFRAIVVSYPDSEGNVVSEIRVDFKDVLVATLKNLAIVVIDGILAIFQGQLAEVNTLRQEAGLPIISLEEYLLTIIPDFALPQGVTFENYGTIINSLDITGGYGQISVSSQDGTFEITTVEPIYSSYLTSTSDEETYETWNTDSVTDMSYMFKNATDFDKEIRSQLRDTVDLTDMFDGATAFLDKYGISATPQSEFFTSLTDTTIRLAIADFFDADKKAELLQKHGKIKHWFTVDVSDMNGLFRGKSDFNEEIEGWDVSNVSNFENMFSGATNFNKPINKWTIKETGPINMKYMFDGAASLDVEIRGWRLPTATELEGIIYGATKLQARYGLTELTNVFFIYNRSDLLAAIDLYESVAYDRVVVDDEGNETQVVGDVSSFEALYGPIEKLYTNTVTDMSFLFYFRSKFNADISAWDVSNVTSMYGMFLGASVFNQDIGDWDVSQVTNMRSMFNRAAAFNQAIGQWDVSQVITMRYMFYIAAAFNQNIGQWNVSRVTDMRGMFMNAAAFNQDIGQWNVTQVTDMNSMFYVAAAFNQAIGQWNVSQVTDMLNMFHGAAAFNQDIGQWNVSQVTNMASMFRGAAAFNQAIGQWNVSQVTRMAYMFWGAAAFNQDISRKVVEFQTENGVTSSYIAWDTSNVDYMNRMFWKAHRFNADIGSWDVSNVKNMDGMFFMATDFNQDISKWRTDSLNTITEMFAFATDFNQDISTKEIQILNEDGTPSTNDNDEILTYTAWDMSKVKQCSEVFRNYKNYTTTEGVYLDKDMKIDFDISKWNLQFNTELGLNINLAGVVDPTNIGNEFEQCNLSFTNLEGETEYFTLNDYVEKEELDEDGYLINDIKTTTSGSRATFYKQYSYSSSSGTTRRYGYLINTQFGPRYLIASNNEDGTISYKLTPRRTDKPGSLQETNIKSVFSGSIDSTTLPDFKISKNVNKQVLKQSLLTDFEDNVKTKTWSYVYTPEDVSETVSGYQHSSYNSVNKNHMLIVNPKEDDMDVVTGFSNDKFQTSLMDSGFVKSTPTSDDLDIKLYSYQDIGTVQKGEENASDENLTKTVKDVLGDDCVKFSSTTIYTGELDYDSVKVTQFVSVGAKSDFVKMFDYMKDEELKQRVCYQIFATEDAEVSTVTKQYLMKPLSHRVNVVSDYSYGTDEDFELAEFNVKRRDDGIPYYVITEPQDIFDEEDVYVETLSVLYREEGVWTLRSETEVDTLSVSQLCSYSQENGISYGLHLSETRIVDTSILSRPLRLSVVSISNHLVDEDNFYIDCSPLKAQAVYSTMNFYDYSLDDSSGPLGQMVTQPENSLLAKNNGIIIPNMQKEYFGNDINNKSALLALIDLHESDRYSTNLKYGLINNWDVSRVTDMSQLFYFRTEFNSPIGSWNVSNVTDMRQMFSGAATFNQPIGSWDVSRVTDMEGMFYAARSFNQDISQWDVSNVTTMYYMFQEANAFNQDISTKVVNEGLDTQYNAWDMSKVTDIRYMFYRAFDFNNGDLIGESNKPLLWNISGVESLYYTFYRCFSFNQNISTKYVTVGEKSYISFDTSKVTNCYSTFSDCYHFNNGDVPGGSSKPLNWNTELVTTFERAFIIYLEIPEEVKSYLLPYEVRKTLPLLLFEKGPLKEYNEEDADYLLTGAYNQPFNNGTRVEFGEGENKIAYTPFDLSRCTTVFAMMHYQGFFNQPITLSLGSCNNFIYAFSYMRSFNNTVKISSTADNANFTGVIRGNSSFNLPLDDINTSKGTNFTQFLSGLFEFNQSIDSLDLGNATNLDEFLQCAYKFNQPINQSDLPNLTRIERMMEYAISFNQPINLDTKNVQYFRGFLKGATSFNQPLTLDLRSATTVEGLLEGATSFNQEIVSELVTELDENGNTVIVSNKMSLPTTTASDVSSMLKDCTSFNKSLDKFDFTNVTNMTSFLEGATSFNQGIKDINVGNVTDMTAMLKGCTSFNKSLDGLDTSNVTTMESLLEGATGFNSSIEKMNTANVTTMKNMLKGASSYNKPLTKLDLTNVTTLEGFLEDAVSYNKRLIFSDTDKLNTAAVTSMKNMLKGTKNFNQEVVGLATDNVTIMKSMLEGATSFNKSIVGLPGTSTINVIHMLKGATSYNKSLEGLNTSNLEDVRGLLEGATSFNQPLKLTFPAAISLKGLLKGATAFNSELSDMVLFEGEKTIGQKVFNDDVNGDGTIDYLSDNINIQSTNRGLFTNVAIGEMNLLAPTDHNVDEYHHFKPYNTDISGSDISHILGSTWSVRNKEFVPSFTSNIKNMHGSIVKHGDTTNLQLTTKKNGRGALGNPWLYTVANMFLDAAMIHGPFKSNTITFTVKGDKILSDEFMQETSWYNKEIHLVVYKRDSNGTYRFGEEIHNTRGDMLDSTYFGTTQTASIPDDYLDSDSVVVFIMQENNLFESSMMEKLLDADDRNITFEVKDIDNLFYAKQTTTTTGLTIVGNSIDNLLEGASSFNQPLQQLDTSSIPSMKGLLKDASSFNQELGYLDVSNVEDMSNMFENATAFTGAGERLHADKNIRYWTVKEDCLFTDMFKGATKFQENFFPTAPGYEEDQDTPLGLFFNQDRPCFDASTKILAIKDGKEEYVPICLLKEGDLVQTYKHGQKPIKYIGTTRITLNGPGDDYTRKMYRMKKTGEMTGDLLVTGRHAMLVDDWSNHYCEKRRTEVSKGKIDDKYVLGAAFSKVFKEEKQKKIYNIYHLEIDGENQRYGIYANGVLAESLQKGSQDKLKKINKKI